MFSGNTRREAFLLLLMVAGALSVGAQQPDYEAIYTKFTTTFKAANIKPANDLPKFRTALLNGNDYLAKCGGDPEQEIQKTFVTRQIPPLTDTIKRLELVKRFNDAGAADNESELLSSGKELLTQNRDDALDIALVLASVSFNRATGNAPVESSTDDTIRYAKMALDKLGSATSDKYGLFKYHYKTTACGDGAVNASGWMNYAIGYVLYARQKKTKEALPYLYRAAQNGCATKNFPLIYRSIGDWYIDEGKKIETTMAEKLKAANNVQTDEVKALEALGNGYLDRAIDAYARAYKAATANSDVSQSAKDAYYKKLQDVYSVRFDGKMDGLDQLLAKLPSTPLADPLAEVKPVVDPVPSAVPPPAPTPPPPAAKRVKPGKKTRSTKTRSSKK